jgi:conjugative relaxase-like TrwC/TraI family protein
MLSISKPLSAGQAARYHAEEFRNARDNYYTAGDEIHGHWHGQLAEQWGLAGDVDEAHFQRLAQGHHPITDDTLVRHQTARAYETADGHPVQTMEHRAGWDLTFSAPKSVSLTALVGGDDRVREAHRASVAIALDELEHYVQARIGSNHPAETTGRWVAASFEHDSARPVDGYAAPQLHTHVVVFNVTETAEGHTRALQPRELYKSQQYATAVYRSELALRVKELGYDIERGQSGQPEIRGYTPEYLEASSQRRQQIQDHLAEGHLHGPNAPQIAAHQTREPKLDLTHDEMQARHQALAATFGHQPAHVVKTAQAHVQTHAEAHVSVHAEDVGRPEPALTAAAAVTYGKERNFEREAVVDERDLLRDALKRSMGEVHLAGVKADFGQRVEAAEFVAMSQRPGAASREFTTPEMIQLEHDSIAMMRAGQGTQASLAPPDTREAVLHDYPHLSDTQRTAVDQLLANRDQVQALEGVAGAGKTTTLAAVRDGAERAGYAVEGLAPTSRAAHQLSEAGIESATLQRHLARQDPDTDISKHLYVLDESSLASTRQMHAFLQRLEPDDRVLLVGDVRQHQAVEAGRPYQQLHEAGIETARLDDIVRQKDPALKEVVEHLARGDVREAVAQLDSQGRIHEMAGRDQRIEAIAGEYMKHPSGTLIVSPDNQSRREINEVIHRAMQDAGQVTGEEHRVRVLVPRQEVTGADRQWAEQYQPDNVIRYTRGSATYGLDAREYVRVEHVNPKENLLTVERATGEQVTYDPGRFHGVTVYREAARALATSDRVQFTAPDRDLHVANRELATVEKIETTGAVEPGQLHLRLDSGRSVTVKLDQPAHLDYGYAVTSHSSQGQTADRVLVHIDTDRGGERLVNQRLAYVAVSRGRFDAQIYTNDKAQLAHAISRDVSHSAAIEPGRSPASHEHKAPANSQKPAEHSVTQVIGI